MNWHDFPPLASLRAFEATARTGSYSTAGRELNVTHAAVMQQVRSLESFLGLRLVERAGRGIAVTADGGMLADHLSRGFGQIETALRLLNQREEGRPVHISMTPSFAVSWFMPRMPLFSADHPDIDLRVSPTVELVDFNRNDCDVAIRFGNGQWRGIEIEPLMHSSFVIVGAPSLLKRWSGHMADLVNLPWIEELGTTEVRNWLAAQSIETPPSTRITQLPGYLVREAVRNGQGIAAEARIFVEDDLATGRLIAVHEEKEDPDHGYHLLYRQGERRPAVKSLLKWLREISRDAP